jgi:protein tyrosine phosphatase (PTP) superfamily phosphohydrolase (DUF442 family)
MQMSGFRIFLTLTLLQVASGCQQQDRVVDRVATGGGDAMRTAEAAMKIEKEGLHNVYQINGTLLSGSSPEGDEGFRSLQELGIQTIISVDGARPDVDRAHQFGLQYVHLPVGYEGISRPQTLRLAKAVRDLPGPVYLHCHHGKHRGPAAAAAIQLCLDESCTVEHVIAVMKQAGTDPHYSGLYSVPRLLIRPTPVELDQVPAEFPEVADVSGLAQLMVEIDARWDQLKKAYDAGWVRDRGESDQGDHEPGDHEPGDHDPPHEALMLAEHFREANRRQDVQDRPALFQEMLIKADEAAVALGTTLRLARETESWDRDLADQSFQRIKVSCVNCHEKYRDISQGDEK